MILISPGRMRDRITFQRKAAPSGGRLNAPRKTDWQDVAGLVGLRAEVQDILPSKAEGIDSDAINTARRPARIRMWRRDGISSDMRILVLSPEDAVTRTLRIIAGPAFVGRRREGIELMAEEVSSGESVA
jgi:head-tail adaptor